MGAYDEQHYVPKSYQKNFSLNNMVFRMDLTNNMIKTEPIPIGGQCKKKHLYEFHKSDGSIVNIDHKIEKYVFTGIIEKILNKTIKNLISGLTLSPNFLYMTKDFESDLLHSIIFMFLRNYKIREILEKENPGYTENEISKADIKFLSMLGSKQMIENLVSLMSDSGYIIFFRAIVNNFILSDMPAIFYFGDSADIPKLVYMPISDKYAVAIVPGIDDEKKQIINADNTLVDMLNCLMSASAKNCYSKNIDTLEQLNRLLDNLKLK